MEKATKKNMPSKATQISLFDDEKNSNYTSSLPYIGDYSVENTMSFYDELNNDTSHFMSNDDICTPMSCVKRMIDYIPHSFWDKKSLRILEPCAGNGNFGAYCKFKTNINNIWFNELNKIRYENCKNLLSPKHISHNDFFALNGEWASGFDLIVANPPYSGGGNKNRSLSNEFIESSIDMLNNGGYLCYVTPNNWMTYNNNNTTLKKLLALGSFLVIDNDVKKFFPGVGSSFTIMLWQKGVYDNKTLIINSFLKKDTQVDVKIPNNLEFIPLYISQTVLDIIPYIVGTSRNRFNYRCDLHNHTQKALLRDIQDDTFKYETVHTLRKTRYACKKQDIYDKWLIIIPLSTYYIPIIKHNVNVTQSVGYIAFDKKVDATKYMDTILKPEYKLIIHLTRYGNFNNLMVLKHLNFDKSIKFTKKQLAEINDLVSLIKY